MPTFWYVIIAVLVLALGAAWLSDRRARRAGRRLRPGRASAQVSADRRDARAGQGYAEWSQDLSWTERSRRERGEGQGPG